MTLVDLFRPEHVYVDPPWATFEAAIEGMVDGIARAGSIPQASRDTATAALLLRERDSSTAIPEIGLAIPHARLEGLVEPVAALAVAARGLYDEAPSLPIRIMVLVLSPQRATDAHLQLLAGVAMGLRSPALRTALLRATTPTAAIQAFATPI